MAMLDATAHVRPCVRACADRLESFLCDHPPSGEDVAYRVLYQGAEFVSERLTSGLASDNKDYCYDYLERTAQQIAMLTRMATMAIHHGEARSIPLSIELDALLDAIRTELHEAHMRISSNTIENLKEITTTPTELHPL